MTCERQLLPKSERTALQKTNKAVAESDYKRRHRRVVCSILLASIIFCFTVKENLLVSLDKFIVATTVNDEQSGLSDVNNTFHTESVLGRRQSSVSLASKQSAKYPPLSCSGIFHEDRNKARPFGDPNNGELYARRTKTVPSFWASIHNKKFDHVRWSIMDNGQYYETIESQAFVDIIRADVKERRSDHHQHQQLLQSTTSESRHRHVSQQQQLPPPPLHVLDVGGNIGWYTLISVAAAMEQGYPIVVDVFEPNPRNHHRLCESLFLNEWLRHDQVAVNLYPLGVTSDSMVHQSSTGRLDVSNSGRGSLDAMKRENTNRTVSFPLVSLDQMSKELDWMGAANHQSISILKVDVEGYESDVFQGAQQLLKSRMVQNVFFEGNIFNNNERDKFQRMVEVLVECGYAAYKVGGSRGANQLVNANWIVVNSSSVLVPDGTSRLVEYSNQLISECEEAGPGEKKRRKCNMWWRLM